jgi:hypothetical protein
MSNCVIPFSIAAPADCCGVGARASPVRPTAETHPRKWLQIKAGYRTIKMIEVPSADPRDVKMALSVAQAVADVGSDYSFIRVHGAGLAVFTSKSINYEALGHAGFCRLNSEIDAVIVAETGHDPETLLQAHRRAA